MANRKRLIATELLEDERLMEGGDTVALLWVGLVLNADDYGIVKAHPGLVTSFVFRFGQHTATEVAAHLAWLEERGFLIPFDYHGARYYALKSWWKWQALSHPALLSLEVPPDVVDAMANAALDGARVKRIFSTDYQRGLAKARQTARSKTTPTRTPATRRKETNGVPESSSQSDLARRFD